MIRYILDDMPLHHLDLLLNYVIMALFVVAILLIGGGPWWMAIPLGVLWPLSYASALTLKFLGVI